MFDINPIIKKVIWTIFYFNLSESYGNIFFSIPITVNKNTTNDCACY